MPLAGKVQAKWGEGPNASCEADYSLPPESQNQAEPAVGRLPLRKS
jgi:outer membrane usher protein